MPLFAEILSCYIPPTLPIAQQFICKKCRSLSTVQTFEQTRNGEHFAVCTECEAKNQIVLTGAPPSRPGVLPVLRLLD